jgi:hypothetical protein
VAYLSLLILIKLAVIENAIENEAAADLFALKDLRKNE